MNTIAPLACLLLILLREYYACVVCPMGMQPHCDGISTKRCDYCPVGTFSEKHDETPCINCTKCSFYTASCTRYSDSQCRRQRCPPGEFFDMTCKTCPSWRQRDRCEGNGPEVTKECMRCFEVSKRPYVFRPLPNPAPLTPAEEEEVKLHSAIAAGCVPGYYYSTVADACVICPEHHDGCTAELSDETMFNCLACVPVVTTTARAATVDRRPITEPVAYGLFAGAIVLYIAIVVTAFVYLKCYCRANFQAIPREFPGHEHADHDGWGTRIENRPLDEFRDGLPIYTANVPPPPSHKC